MTDESESVSVNTEEVFDAVGDMRTAFYWDDVRTAIEPPDLGVQSPTDILWRLANLVRNMRERYATQLEECAKAIVQGAIDAHVADEPSVVEVATGTTTSTSVVPSTASPTAANDSEPVTESVTTTSSTTTTTVPAESSS